MKGEKIAPTIAEAMAWVEICRRFPEEWVLLVDVEHEREGSIRSARLVGHDRSMKSVLNQVDALRTDALAYAHTGGRRLRPPRRELTKEIPRDPNVDIE